MKLRMHILQIFFQFFLQLFISFCVLLLNMLNLFLLLLFCICLLKLMWLATSNFPFIVGIRLLKILLIHIHAILFLRLFYCGGNVAVLQNLWIGHLTVRSWRKRWPRLETTRFVLGLMISGPDSIFNIVQHIANKWLQLSGKRGHLALVEGFDEV